MKKLTILEILILFLGLLVPSGSAHLVWEEDFDTYTTGQFLDGGSDDGGWKGWGNNPALGATVTNVQSFTTPHSVDINGASHLVREYHGHTTGIWQYKAWQYVPENYSGVSYFSLLSSYDDAGGTNIWNVQLWFDSDLGLVGSDFDGNTVPLIKGQWKKIFCIINLDSDFVQIYYADTLIVEKPWSDTIQGTGGGPMTFEAVELFANNASSIYYDRMAFFAPGPYLICFAGGPYFGEINVPVQFNGDAYFGTEPYNWAWDFGDGDTATIQNPTHTYATPGMFIVTLTVTDLEGAHWTDETTATITAPLPMLEIGFITGGFGIQSKIKNIGDGTATNVSWSITLDGRFVFVGKSSNGTFGTIAVGGEEVIKTGFIFGFGKINILIIAKAENSLEVSTTKTAFLIGPFVVGIR